QDSSLRFPQKHRHRRFRRQSLDRPRQIFVEHQVPHNHDAAAGEIEMVHLASTVHSYSYYHEASQGDTLMKRNCGSDEIFHSMKARRVWGRRGPYASEDVGFLYTFRLYIFWRRRRDRPSPSRSVPSSAREPGSGAVTGVVETSSALRLWPRLAPLSQCG